MIVLVEGKAEGPLIALSEPLSFWGGFDARSGAINDEAHPECGTVLTGGVVLLPHSRGSSSSSSVLAEAIRLGTAPAALLLREPDHILAIGALVANHLYGTRVPVIVVAESLTLEPGWCSVAEDGSVLLERSARNHRLE